MRADRERIARVLARACPYCHAEPGDPCVSLTGSPVLNADNWCTMRRMDIRVR
ncbi:zinc finger domain-containing protein [Actinopolymorpha pittospori]